jgi:hypothetical protein
MDPTSEELEAFYDRLKYIDGKLDKLGSKEIKRSDTIRELYELARDWLRVCSALRTYDWVAAELLNSFDVQMIELQHATECRTRASAYRKIVAPLLSQFFEWVIVPAIRFEASPAQVASRDLMNILSGQITPVEITYIDEASRCLTLRCHRAAIIMLWAAAMARFHSAIEQIGYDKYNLALVSTVSKKISPFKNAYNTPISSLAELQKIRDFDILVLGMELWKYDYQTFEEQERLLGTRNNAAHPGMSNPNALDVLQFARKLNDFIFKKIRLISPGP